jgi:glutathione reductase (NADPH)
VLVSTVELFWRATKGKELGLRGTQNLAFDWPAVIERKDRIVQSWSKGKEEGLSQLGIAIVKGKAIFTDAHELAVDGKRISAKKMIIATGSKPGRPSIPGVELGIASDELIHLKEQPSRLVVVGGGFIGLEFGFALARAGSKVTILQSGPRIAPALDDDIREELLKSARDAGIEVVTGIEVRRINPDKSVAARTGAGERAFPADQVLLATGRPSNVAALGPEKAGVELDASAVKVNEFLQSVTAPHIYAVGDAAGKHQHTPVAWYEGPIAAHNALAGNEKKVDFTIFPSAVFTIPAIGQVGLTETVARNRRKVSSKWFTRKERSASWESTVLARMPRTSSRSPRRRCGAG